MGRQRVVAFGSTGGRSLPCPSDYGLDGMCERNPHPEHGPPLGGWHQAQRPANPFSLAPCDGQSQARSYRFGGKALFEDTVLEFLRYSGPRISHEHIGSVVTMRLDPHFDQVALMH